MSKFDNNVILIIVNAYKTNLDQFILIVKGGLIDCESPSSKSGQ